MADDLVERVARAIAEAQFGAGVWSKMTEPERNTYLPLAEAAIRLVLEEAALKVGELPYSTEACAVIRSMMPEVK